MSEKPSTSGQRFLAEKYKLQRSDEVQSTTLRTKTRTGESVPPTREAQIENYLSRFEEITRRETPEKRKNGLAALKRLLHKKYIIQKLPASHLDLQRRIAIDNGQGADLPDEFAPEQLSDYLETIQKDQKESLDAWIDELAETGDEYPAWAKYWAIRSMLQMGPYVKSNHRFSKRSPDTTAPFPDLDQEALSIAVDYIIAMQEGVPPENPVEAGENEYAVEGKLVSDADFTKILNSEDFAKYYAFAIEHVTADNSELFKVTAGEWRLFPQGSDPHLLTSTIQGYGTGWCTAGTNTARIQLEAGDFYVYYSKNDLGEVKIPRLAIWMNDDTIKEVRGVAHKQEIDPYIAHVLEEKMSEFGAQGEQYKKKAHNMKWLTTLVQKQSQGEQFTKDDALFLYEVNSKIEGFGYRDDPRVQELRNERNRQQDIEMICDCLPEYIATDTNDISETTQVFCHDDGSKISLVDFREEKNKEKLPKIIKFSEAFRETGSPAQLDLAIEGGIVSLEIGQKTLESLRTYDSAIAAYKAADSSPTYIYDQLQNIPWHQPNVTSLDVYILNHERTSSEERDQMVIDMDKAGYRALTFAELVTLGIVRPDLNKRNEVFNTSEKHTLDGSSQVPCLYWSGDERYLFADFASGGWSARDRFVFVRK